MGSFLHQSPSKRALNANLPYSGPAQTAVHADDAHKLPEFVNDPSPGPGSGMSVLEVLSHLYSSPALQAPDYDLHKGTVPLQHCALALSLNRNPAARQPTPHPTPVFLDPEGTKCFLSLSSAENQLRIQHNHPAQLIKLAYVDHELEKDHTILSQFDTTDFSSGMAHASYLISKKGSLNLPGITTLSKQTAEELLLKDAEEHHCFINTKAFHNHLSHHVLAAYDLGAPAAVLERIYEKEKKLQRPFYLEENHRTDFVVTKDNWTEHLGNRNAYGAYVKFFEEEIKVLGAKNLLETYMLSEDANKDGRRMFVRLASGVSGLHPLIAVGYGLEFGNDELVATGLAQAAVHKDDGHEMLECVNDGPAPGQGISLLEVLSQVYESKALEPLPYDPDKSTFRLQRDALAKSAAACPIVSQFRIPNSPTPTEVSNAIEEIIWVSNLLPFASGKRGRKTRLDFLLMHVLTCSIFLQPLCDALEKPEYQAKFLRAYVAGIIFVMMWRGVPRIDPELAMSPTATPRSPVVNDRGPTAALGDPNDDAAYNPWPAIIEDAQYHADVHLVKAIRGVLYASRRYGHTKAGDIPGAYRDDEKTKEVFRGIGKVDGTLFVRSAGVLMDQLGWMTYGQTKGDWNYVALGWDEAWDALED
ncbi:hypothetical protein CVT24_002888 [Panaeolus cyanescens]|uniref:Oxidoreductase AflY n=1 Tax=Panaeolus cyanescens TaxID=181874 RepID=A0A409W8N9_9AGAR|nr:hypothetical protein CVT24_002888 [Panaeolus cyanescens]